MTLNDIKGILNAQVLTGEQFLDRKVSSAFGSDLMSDVLAFVDNSSVLLTGLTNPQVIRTAEMIDLFAIIFVRGKRPSDEIIKMGQRNNITILMTDYTLYTSCGKLYENGLKGIEFEKGVMT
ncbi:DRTGG domain-containing protein [Thermohalobacter berrensis]|uniref:DRTGG domain-containing protein n=1 Tax=Thermohalobacter berrensis TaxID=99594 RepID=A0A419T6J3_9FIRM|nr:DRTGG domain-containing protein [Thermohalobacter berrensis]RKD33217.1 hypothetical protein BET03_09730 [Thermohalobacter berrensis]